MSTTVLILLLLAVIVVLLLKISLLAIPADWEPTNLHISRLPTPVRNYIWQLQARLRDAWAAQTPATDRNTAIAIAGVTDAAQEDWPAPDRMKMHGRWYIPDPNQADQ